MANISPVISSLNHKILRSPTNEQFGCNCRSKPDCPLQNKCLTPKVIYQTNVTNNVNNEERFYRGLAETPFKERFRNHAKEFKYDKYRNNTELSKYIWQLDDDDISANISWEIISQVNSNTRINFCVLC